MANLRRRARRTVALEYGPQFAELDRLLAGARRTYRSGKRSERQAARWIIASAQAARPGVRRGYRESMRANRRASALTDANVSDDSIFADALAQEVAGFRRRSAEQRSGELQELRNREMRAVDAAIQNTRALQGEFAETKADIGQQRQALAAQQGAAVLDLLATLRDERADRRLAVRSQAEEERHNLEMEAQGRAEEQRLRRQNRREARSGDGGGSDLTYAQRRDRRADIAQARSWLQKLRSAGVSLSDAEQLLIRGEKIPTKGGDDVSLPDIPAQFVRKAAKDLRKSSGLSGFLNSLGR